MVSKDEIVPLAFIGLIALLVIMVVLAKPIPFSIMGVEGEISALLLVGITAVLIGAGVVLYFILKIIEAVKGIF